jgi:hypothetical protein
VFGLTIYTSGAVGTASKCVTPFIYTRAD